MRNPSALTMPADALLDFLPMLFMLPDNATIHGKDKERG